MDQEESISVTKIVTDDSIYYIKVAWMSLSLHLRLYDDKESWDGFLDYDSVKALSSEVSVTEETYYENLKEALGASSENYAHEFVKEAEDTGEFIWKKKYPDGVVLIYGSIKLSRDIDSNKNILIDFLLLRNIELTRKLDEICNKSDNLYKELELCKSDWTKDIEVKNSIESELYGKFVKLLNTKKRRIQVLEQTLLEK